MHARAWPERDFRADADAYRFDGVNAHDGLRQTAIELSVPLHIGPESRWQARRNHLECAAERVSGVLGGVDGRNHARLNLVIGAAKAKRIIGKRERLIEGHDSIVWQGHAADRGDMAGDADPEAAEQLTGE